LKALVAEIHQHWWNSANSSDFFLRSLRKFQRNFYKAKVFGKELSGARVVLRLQCSSQRV
jgi:hypothetical protein